MQTLKGNSLIEFLLSVRSFLSVGKYEKATIFDPDPDRVPRPKATATPGSPERSAHKWSVGVHKERVSCHVTLLDHAVEDKAKGRNAFTSIIVAFGSKMRDCITLERLAGSKGRVPITDSDYDFIYPQIQEGMENEFCADLDRRKIALDAIKKAKANLPKVSSGGGGSYGGSSSTAKSKPKVPTALEFYHGTIKNPKFPSYTWKDKKEVDLWDMITENQEVIDEIDAEWIGRCDLEGFKADDLFRAIELGLWESGRIPSSHDWKGGYKTEKKSVDEKVAIAAGLDAVTEKGKVIYKGPRQEIEVPA